MDRFLSPDAQTELCNAITEAHGNEVFCLGRTDGARRVATVEVLARGHRRAVPAILQHCRPGDVVIHNHPGGNLTPSDADLEIASRLGSMGVGFYIIDNRAEQLYRVVEALTPQARRTVAVDQVADLLAPGGRISSALAGFEDRPEQLRMAFAVLEAFNRDCIALVEAGTGTGKSLAYLVPALLWALANEERVVVSTNTINLQEQLIRKDLPFLQRTSGLEFRIELVKGRGNYLCRRRLETAVAEPGLFDSSQADELVNLRAWAAQTVDGSREELPVPPSEQLWDEVCCEADQCARAQCRHFNSCFFHQARRRAAQADVLVVNHALLLADLALRQQTDNYTAAAVLPPFDRLVLDEAHHLEEVATRYFSTQVTRFGFVRALNRLRHPRKPQHGLLPRLLTVLGRDLPDSADQLYRDLHGRIEGLLGAAHGLLTRSAGELEEIGEALCLLAGLPFPGRVKTPEGHLSGRSPAAGHEELRQRLVPALTTAPAWPELAGRVRALAADSERLGEQLEALLRALGNLPEPAVDNVRSVATDLGGIALRLQGLGAQLRAFVGGDEDTCAWFEVVRARTGRGEGVIVKLCTAPLEVAPLLRESLFERMRTVALTSATLTVAGTFRYLRARIGLGEVETGRLCELRLASPFDYARQALVAVPTDIPEPGKSGYTEAVRDLTEKAILCADGRSFVLFTAYSLLKRVHGELAPLLTARGYHVLRQGEATRHRLLERFCQDPTSVLFATDSFWEGVDVPGRALEQVIIARLPFKVPTEPVLEARAEAIEKAGGDPFIEYTVPQAVIRFRQGFGRLIRNRTDRGVVLILDSRVVRRGYGRMFLTSLPDVPVTTLPTAELLAAMQSFFAREP
jgi:ATP-dependent DNA helicase DinG